MKNEVRRLDENAIAEMKKYGLNVVPPQDMPAWQKLGEDFRTAMRGTVMVADTMDQVMALHREYQSKRGAAAPAAPAAAPAKK